MRLLKKLLAGLAVMSLVGCTAMTTSISHKNLVAQTKMSDTIFLQPVPDDEQVVYVQVKNTSDQADFEVTEKIKKSITSRGYQVTDDMAKAHYILQANVLKVTSMTPEEAKNVQDSTFNSALSGGAVGAGVGALSGNGKTALAAGLVGAAIGTIADAAVKDITYVAVVDLQISERVAAGDAISHKSTSKLKNGSSETVQNSSGDTQWKRYQTRLTATADKVNLKYAEAQPVLEQNVANSVAGIF
jgi:hypothetical protein